MSETEKPVGCGCKPIGNVEVILGFGDCIDSSACEVQSLRAQLAERDADIRGYFKIRDAAKSELECVRLAHDCLVAQRHMTIARLGGEVEGGPTCEINFLQRVDELREKEAQLEQAQKDYTKAIDLASWNHRQLEEKEREIARYKTALKSIAEATLVRYRYAGLTDVRRLAAFVGDLQTTAEEALTPETKEQG